MTQDSFSLFQMRRDNWIEETKDKNRRSEQHTWENIYFIQLRFLSSSFYCLSQSIFLSLTTQLFPPLEWLLNIIIIITACVGMGNQISWGLVWYTFSFEMFIFIPFASSIRFIWFSSLWIVIIISRVSSTIWLHILCPQTCYNEYIQWSVEKGKTPEKSSVLILLFKCQSIFFQRLTFSFFHPFTDLLTPPTFGIVGVEAVSFVLSCPPLNVSVSMLILSYPSVS